MKKRLISLGLALLLLLGAGSAAAANTAGSASDPLITLQYISGAFIPQVLREGRAAIQSALAERGNPAAGFQTARYAAGSSFTLRTGGSVIVTDGAATLAISSGTVIDLTRGAEVYAGTMRSGDRYMAAENSTATVTLTSVATVTTDGNVGIRGEKLSTEFADVPADHWAYDYVNQLAYQGVINGVAEGQFAPEKNMTRADFVTVLGRAAGVDTSAYASSAFSDVSAGSYYGPYVAWAAEKGVVNGIADDLFDPQGLITRAQMAVILVRFADATGITLPDNGNSTPFADDEEIADWAYDAVYTARAAGIIDGKDGNVFDPQGNATRAQVCAVIYRLLYT